MTRNRNSALLALALLLAVCAACKKQEAPPPAAPKKAQPAKFGNRTGAAQKQLSSAKGAARLEFSKRTDPFKPYIPIAPAPATTTTEAGTTRPTADLLPIQSFEVHRFKVAGIIAGINQNRALLIDPNGKGYVVQEGMEIGNSEGRIVKITSSTVEVVERFKEDNGRIRKRKVVLTLAKKR